MSGRPAAACALYAAFLASWAFGAALLRRDPGPYLPLGIVLLGTTVLAGALVALTGGLGGSEPAVHAGYLLASVAILPIGWALAASERGRDPLTLAITLAFLVVVILRVDATAA